jgi:pyruvate/2-oxoglutarate/acetoin dehydrogenase E1 component/TPP-dependent pyruvate/acetoin dehydrogenase alpha subunit
MLNFKEFSGIQTNDQNREYLEDLWVAFVSREASISGRKEVLSGKAKFGILGDGKEIPQIAMSKCFKKGDYRAGYYRDQTFMFHRGLATVNDFFAQLYADSERDPFSKGRQMNNHFATPFIDIKGNWLDLSDRFNVSSDVSSTGAQMARAFGLAMASKKYRALPDIPDSHLFSNGGNEVCFCTIGDSSTSEGTFWETMNAAAVNKIPLAVVVWDNGYGISVPTEMQTTKGDISFAMLGLQKEENSNGIMIFKVKAGNYPELIKTFQQATDICRNDHIPVLVHVVEVTQPLGHSTSGSHERYKTKERLQWEKKNDPTLHYINWLLEKKITDQETIEILQNNAKEYVKAKKSESWKNLISDTKKDMNRLNEVFTNAIKEFPQNELIKSTNKELQIIQYAGLSTIAKYAQKLKLILAGKNHAIVRDIDDLLGKTEKLSFDRYHTHLYSSSERSALSIKEIEKEFLPDSPEMPGYLVLNRFFDKKFGEDRRLLAFGEDVGYIGDVNQGFAGLQDKYGKERVFDTGIREWNIMGEAIGLAMRGFRPIAEIQYLDYLIYGHPPLSDDLATLRYRSGGTQIAPAIIRTRGHRLEGIWHAGSPLGMLINSLRGIYILTPRNMVQAAGMYNTMLRSDDPAIVIECLNGYRLKEKMPANLGEYTVPLGKPEVLTHGTDVTIVTYGSMVREVMEALLMLGNLNISAELIDAQTLLPFDVDHSILVSLKKTGKLVVADEDVPGGASAYILQKILEEQGAFDYLDHPPLTITAQEHRPPYGSDGDYFSKPNPEMMAIKIYNMMHEYHPAKYPAL